MKQDEAQIKVELLDSNKRVLIFYATLQENGFAEFTQEYYHDKAVKVTLMKIERDIIHDHEIERFPELKEKEQ